MGKVFNILVSIIFLKLLQWIVFIDAEMDWIKTQDHGGDVTMHFFLELGGYPDNV